MQRRPSASARPPEGHAPRRPPAPAPSHGARVRGLSGTGALQPPSSWGPRIKPGNLGTRRATPGGLGLSQHSRWHREVALTKAAREGRSQPVSLPSLRDPAATPLLQTHLGSALTRTLQRCPGACDAPASPKRTGTTRTVPKITRCPQHTAAGPVVTPPGLHHGFSKHPAPSGSPALPFPGSGSPFWLWGRWGVGAGRE